MVFTVVRDPLERFTEKYEVDDSGCWLWTGATKDNGYGVFWVYEMGRNDYAHRWSYGHHVGSIPSDLEIDHLCNRRACVNPLHLEPVTHAENNRRKAERTTECPSGHAWDEKNTRYYRGSRRCRACDLAAYHRAKAKA